MYSHQGQLCYVYICLQPMVRIYDIPDNTFETDEEDESSEEDSEEESEDDGRYYVCFHIGWDTVLTHNLSMNE